MNAVLKKLPSAFQYLRYKLVSADSHGLHSPFVFDLYNQVIKDSTPFYAFTIIESVRSKMLLSEEKIEVLDLGTGRQKSVKKKQSLRFIAKYAVKPVKDGQLLFRLVNYFHPVQLLELGTSLGISTMYLAAPDSHSRVITVEGCPNTAAVAQRNFKLAGFGNIRQVVGEFSEVLTDVLDQLPQLDFVYFDGNHRKDATLDYFKQCLSKHHEHSVFVFDDIHWSSGMQEAWKKIKAHESVTLTIDLFSLGIVFFRKGMNRQHFILKYY